MGPAVPMEDPVPVFSPAADDGCEVSRSCLVCPLPRCRYDDPFWWNQWKRGKRNRAIIAAVRSQAKTVVAVAEEFGMSPRNVLRILKREKGQ